MYQRPYGHLGLKVHSLGEEGNAAVMESRYYAVEVRARLPGSDNVNQYN
jgi:hypothetical protein